MASLNQVTIIGNLGRDPESRTFPSGDMVANISVATTDKWKDKQSGEIKSATEWHRVVLNGRMAEVAVQYLRSGSQVCIQGSLRTRKWTDNAGVEKYSTEIRADNLVMLGSPNQAGSNQRGGGRQGGGYDDGQGGYGQDGGGYDNGGYDQGGNNGGGQQPQQRQQQNNQRQGNQGGGGQRQQGNGGGQQRQAQQQQRGPQQNQQRPQQNQQAQQPPQRSASGFDDMDDDIPF